MKILLIEDQPLFREGLVDILQKQVDPAEVSCVANVAEALEALDGGAWQLVVADLSTGDLGARPGLEDVIDAAGDADVALLDARPVAAHRRRAQLAGAKAYIAKTSSRELIEAALGVVLAGGSYFSDLAPLRADDRPAGDHRLSPRQAEVLDLLHGGFRNEEIAQALGISVATVKLHVHAILKSTGARSRVDLLVRNIQAVRAPAASLA
jgi:DNA-binding NarL/FixJ family response regulator